jgi:hypothetical protein
MYGHNNHFSFHLPFSSIPRSIVTMPGQQDYSKTFWLAYCDAIRGEIGTDLDDNTAIWYPTVDVYNIGAEGEAIS